MSILIRQLALVSESSKIARADVLKVSAALQKQVTRDLAPIWGISATVDPFDSLDDVPAGYWPLVVRDDIDTPGAAGVHKDQNGQPISLIMSSDTLDTWSLTASHETLEMLVDPSGDRLVAGDSPKPDQGRVSFLVEVCDPSEASTYAYSVNGILVSDFYTPNFFDPVRASGVRYSYTGAITEPRQVLKGGYLSWVDPASNIWWQETWFDDDVVPGFRSLGQINSSATGSLRTVVDSFAMAQTTLAIALGRQVAEAAGLEVSAMTSNASHWRTQIDGLLSRSTDGSKATARRRSAPRIKPA